MSKHIYNRLLTYSKHQSLSKKINNLKGDTKGPYQLTANFTGATSQNSVPPGKTDTQLAEKFTEFFIDKKYKVHQQGDLAQ